MSALCQAPVSHLERSSVLTKERQCQRVEGIPGRGSGRESCVGVGREVKELAAYPRRVVQLSTRKAFLKFPSPECLKPLTVRSPENRSPSGGIGHLSQSDREERPREGGV